MTSDPDSFTPGDDGSLAQLDVRTLGGTRVLVVADDGPPLGTGDGLLDVVGDALGVGAEVVAVPLGRLGDDFLRLRTRVAGEVLQKFVNYRLRVAVVGDVTAAVAASDALRDFVRESDRGRHVWFVADLDALASRLEG